MKYISLLRGINVSGQKKILMQDLKSLFENLEFKNVITYIQSGNVIFDSPEKNKDALKNKIEIAINQHYKFKVPTEIRTHVEIQNIIKNCPFKSIDFPENGTKILVSFLSATPSKTHVKDLEQFVISPEKLIIKNKEAYLYCPNGYGKSKLTNNFLEKKLAVKATTRNWKSIQKIRELSMG